MGYKRTPFQHPASPELRKMFVVFSPQLHLLPEVGDHLVPELLELLGLLLVAHGLGCRRPLHLDLFLQPSDLAPQLADDALVLGHVVGDVQDIFANL